jgi:hypothetical protein
MSSDRFCEETSSIYFLKHPNWHPSFNLGNLTPLNPNSKLEDFIQDYFLLFRKIVIALLKYKLST